LKLPSTSKPLKKLFSAKEREAIVSMVASDPACGDVMEGTGGFRKVRVGRDGMGKRGGARVIYILRNVSFPIFLVAVYGKNEKANLTRKERNELATMSDTIFAKYTKARSAK
jgi:hypothetical protein